MIARAVPLLFLAVLLGLLGCRDTLVDEPLSPDTQVPPADTTTINEIYLKGPVSLRVGSMQGYRAESLPDAVRYQWRLGDGTGTVIGDSDHPLQRLYDITGVSAGPVMLIVQAFDENSDVIGIGTKSISVIE